MDRVLVVTGGSRGIGAEVARLGAEQGYKVCVNYARNKAAAQDVVKTIRDNGGEAMMAHADVAEEADVKAMFRLVDQELGPVTALVNNAGILHRDTLDSLNYEDMLEQFAVNALGPLRVTEALRDRLSAGSKVIIITSRMGSIEDNTSGGYYGYRASKTAVNQIGMSLKHDLEPRGIAVALLHPGMVATDMTGGQGVSAKDSAAGLIKRIDALNSENSGTFWHAEGYALPW